ncbi:MAG: hypothetical protein ACLP50_06005, partial [Solirubrobacteraceae bacterium]
RHFGVATQQRVASGGLDPGSLTEHWLSEELRGAFHLNRQTLRTLAHDSTSYIGRAAFERSAVSERVSVRVATRWWLTVVQRRMTGVAARLCERERQRDHHGPARIVVEGRLRRIAVRLQERHRESDHSRLARTERASQDTSDFSVITYEL